MDGQLKKPLKLLLLLRALKKANGAAVASPAMPPSEPPANPPTQDTVDNTTNIRWFGTISQKKKKKKRDWLTTSNEQNKELYKSAIKRHFEDMGYLEKGLHGNWEAEGYKISHIPRDNGVMEIHAHAPDGKHVGYAMIYPHETEPHALMPMVTSIRPEHQRKGLATAMYRHAENVSGKMVLPSTDQSPDAQKLWNQPKRPSGKSELEKGLHGDWQKEGYRISHSFPEDYCKDCAIHSDTEMRVSVTKDGREVAHAHIGGGHESHDFLWPRGINVDKAHRRKGIASAMYQHAENYYGKHIKPSDAQSEDAIYLWAQPKRPFGKNDWQKSYQLHKEEVKQPEILHHYSRQAGLKSIDPRQMGMGTSGDFNKRFNPSQIEDFPHTSFHYIQNQPEDVVRHGAVSKYTLRLDPDKHKLYDLSHDKEGLVRQAIDENQGAWNYENMLNRIKGAGHYGIWSSASQNPIIANTVQLFHQHPIESEEVA